MAVTLDAAVLAVSLFSRIKNALDLSTPKDEIQRNPTFSFTDGAGANQADEHWSDERTLGASSSESLDLAGGLTDAFGTIITFARIKAIYIEADATNTNNVLVGAPASNGLTSFISANAAVAIKPGGFFLLVAPDAAGHVVTPGTGDLLSVANSGGTTGVKYRIYLLGALT
jgi:hypothetical protein